ncbi:hypothetical protein PC119_g11215 [Phytophthora cactorum]|uniref:Uncharacterized protein n=1 Tax=Phytophthora cactorum TaxID=29920 RepID=A0A8T1CBT5_9STRA|nr:hypothetical protein PC112_g9941 [Phytophthora cactorum]KAG2826651.1 hypothetical protein PC111_g8883 [Phytophthora cactorum]KAG2920097.1 hypothetical protein PC115_g9914 [Phytophthora cactorum]KAG2938487.1 hypothetical protein PC117_g11184 [Phytophthora cactorum]KAG3016821.1 hypothetical protein PC119_g11215 [Phytophthora cactorum]
MDRHLVGELPPIVEQRYGREQTGSNPQSDSDRLRVMEERMDQLQADMQTSHRMLRELNSLVHRQLQITVSRNKNRNLSENCAPMGFNTDKQRT